MKFRAPRTPFGLTLFTAVVSLTLVLIAIGCRVAYRGDVTYELQVLHNFERRILDSEKKFPLPVVATTTATSTSWEKNSGFLTYTTETPAFPAGQKIVLFFYTDWCSTCRLLISDIEENADQIPADLLIYKVDFDRFGALRRRYAVEKEDTLVFMDERGEATILSRSETLDQVLASIKD